MEDIRISNCGLMDFEMHYHVWTRIDLDTMERDPWRYQTRSAAAKYSRRHSEGQQTMVLQCDRILGLSPRQREEVYEQALRLAEDIVIRRGTWGVARATWSAAAARLTDQVADEAVDEEVGDDDVAIMFKEQGAEVERFISRHILEALGNAAGFPLLG